MLLARDPGACDTSALALQQLFELTPSETQVCRSLAQGQSIDDIASACGISISTVKTHLHHIYGKTGTGRQGELIALIHQCIAAAPPSFAPSPPNG
jgi:DNA-binding CsgD family transcriptional regulator